MENVKYIAEEIEQWDLTTLDNLYAEWTKISVSRKNYDISDSVINHNIVRVVLRFFQLRRKENAETVPRQTS